MPLIILTVPATVCNLFEPSKYNPSFYEFLLAYKCPETIIIHSPPRGVRSSRHLEVRDPMVAQPSGSLLASAVRKMPGDCAMPQISLHYHPYHTTEMTDVTDGKMTDGLKPG